MSQLVVNCMYLGTVRNENGGSKVPRNTGHDVDYAYAQRAGHLLQVAHDVPLDGHGHCQVQQASVQEQRCPQPIELVRRLTVVERHHSADVVQTRYLEAQAIRFNYFLDNDIKTL